MTGCSIGRAARATGVNVETIRFYERRGLVPQPPRPTQGYREYGAETIERIRFIRHAQQIGFSLNDIRELLALRTDPGSDCSEVRLRAVAKLGDVNAKICRLQQMRAALETLIAACPGQGAVGSCSILNEIARQNLRPVGSIHPAKPTAKGPVAMITTEFIVDGMHCGGCAKTATALLRQVPGVRKAEVTYPEKRARVLHDPDQASAADLHAAVGQTGYVVRDLGA
ncbi:hypothetical protein U879_21160 [Defluviimonas sp. 20V17]|uniref:Mercuric resistance operon regulatory protein n=1 Tax=Allgaiera indica TaxID=765699 RepID=A0AAN4UTG2_9RHOB|nr:MerR family transcriptional regulator [Allgaiera indica]KDB01673.1 hypothetical protein U879_21160 [Defluviimonas sp. 20V17]GHE03970.1 hypothetical protein GCM10008024_29290 [Allgaiera indica]SDX34838.1 Cu(I)-responsive transcriptional regulator/Hg(II)-responsive transcriptional regulator,TIGR02051 [Allgaiera indica]